MNEKYKNQLTLLEKNHKKYLKYINFQKFKVMGKLTFQRTSPTLIAIGLTAIISNAGHNPFILDKYSAYPLEQEVTIVQDKATINNVITYSSKPFFGLNLKNNGNDLYNPSFELWNKIERISNYDEYKIEKVVLSKVTDPIKNSARNLLNKNLSKEGFIEITNILKTKLKTFLNNKKEQTIETEIIHSISDLTHYQMNEPLYVIRNSTRKKADNFTIISESPNENIIDILLEILILFICLDVFRNLSKDKIKKYLEELKQLKLEQKDNIADYQKMKQIVLDNMYKR